jgi:putative membrane protein
MLDAFLAIIHHVFAFSLVGCLVGEWFLLMEPPSKSIVKRLAVCDAFYGLAAVGSLAIGVCRVLWGVKPSNFYTENPVFWAKMVVWALVAIISIRPTVWFIQWRNRATIPSEAEFARARRFVSWEIAALIFIPVFAALMARGVGLL